MPAREGTPLAPEIVTTHRHAANALGATWRDIEARAGQDRRQRIGQDVVDGSEVGREALVAVTVVMSV